MTTHADAADGRPAPERPPRPPTPPAGPPRSRPGELAALGLASADVHAHGAVPAVPARARGRPGLASCRSGTSTPSRSPRGRTATRPDPALDRLGLFSVYTSPWFSRDLHPADGLADRLHRARGCGSTGEACGPGRRRRPRTSTGCRRRAAFETDEPPARCWRGPSGCCASGATASTASTRAPGRARTALSAVRGRRARLPARGRQPGVPHLGAAGAGRRSPSGAVRLQGRRRSPRRATASPTR